MAKFNEVIDNANGTYSVQGGVPNRLKKITGTRFAAVLGLNHWKSPFAAWCEIMKVAEPPFEGNKYTEAGIAIEPKLIEWCKSEVSPYIVTPEEWFGTKEKLYDHFPNEPILGGMWDGVIVDGKDSRNVIGIIEAKTSSRPQDWTDGVPAHYLYQGLLYAHLIGAERLYFPVTFLTDNDYENPEDFTCTDDNTILFSINVSEYDIAEAVESALWWHEQCVMGNNSPLCDAKADKEYLTILGAHTLTEAELNDIGGMAERLNVVVTEIEAIKARYLKELEKEQKVLKERLKNAMITMMAEDKNSISAHGWKVTKGTKLKIDEKGLEAAGILEQYQIEEETYKLTKTKEI